MPKAVVKKPASRKTAAKKGVKKASARPGRPRVAKADGNAPVQSFINALSGWKKDVAKKFDAIVGREVPNVRRAIKWSSPMYGIAGQGWFAAIGVFSKHLKLTFFRGAELRPAPPAGESQLMRGLDIRETDPFDEKQIASWVQQASKLPGWGSS